jgi:hypothetical protein
MATKLGVWNGALQALGNERLTDTGDPGRGPAELASCYSQVVNECIAAGSWNFAMETAKIAADTGVTPSFGFAEVFAKPSDWVRTIGVSLDEYFSVPLLQYYDDSNFWSADSTPVYFRYVSNDTGLGFALNRWPAQFTRFVELELATRIGPAVTQNMGLIERVEVLRDKARKRALNTDAMNEPQPKFLPPGSWTSARWGGSGRRDRGSRGSLTG